MISLDTNAVIAAINAPHSAVRRRIEDALERGEPVALSSIVLFELHYGIAKSTRQESNRERLREFVAGRIEPLPFDADDAQETGDIRAALERAGTLIGYYDLLIAGQARRREAVLVTANAREFARVPRLRVEDWTAPL